MAHMKNLLLNRRTAIFTGILLIGSMLTTTIQAKDELKNYLSQDDGAFTWELKNKIEAGDLTVYDILLTSQKWRDITWRHQLRLVTPKQPTESKHALLFITGGSNKDQQPNWSSGLKDDELSAIGKIAQGSGSPVAILKQVPNQPLYGDKTEDELISYTFVQYMESKDPTWPLLFPMVKSAIKAMDAVQQFTDKELNWKIENFVVSGGSKRGWTTWLTGANDPRVAGIAPMVIDVLNMPAQMDYQLQVYGKYSEQIEDYEEKGLTDLLRKPGGDTLSAMVDPYSYRQQIAIPKLLFMGTNDPYWTVDAVKHYFNDLVGEKYIHYVPNAGHDLGDGKQAIKALGAYFTTFVKGLDHPDVSWDVTEKDGVVSVKIKSDQNIQNATLWSVDSPDRDFRNDKWGSRDGETQDSRCSAEVPLPREGYRAFYLEAQFESPLGDTYGKSTRVYVLDSQGIVDKRDQKHASAK